MARRLFAALLFAAWALSAQAQTVVHYWSGYWLTSGGPYTQVSATWRLPAIDNSVSSVIDQFIGIGNTGTSLVQIGVFESGGGSQSFSPLCQLWGASGVGVCTGGSCGGICVPPANPSPGDVLIASVTCTANCTASNAATAWTLVLKDVTAGWNWTVTGQISENALNSAEWVVEAPDAPGFPATNYGTATFINLKANNATPTLTLGGNGIEFDDGHATSGPSSLVGNAFSTCWGVSSTYTACVSPGNLAFMTGRFGFP